MKIVDCGGVKERQGERERGERTKKIKHLTFQKNLNGERKKPKEMKKRMKRVMEGDLKNLSCVCMCECLYVCLCITHFVGQMCLDGNNVGTHFPCGDKMQVPII